MTTPKSKQVARLALKGTAWVAFGTYLNIVIGFVGNLVLTRLLSPEIFGFVSLGTFWTHLLSFRPVTGLNFAAIQHKETDGDLLGTYFTLNMIISAISLVLGFGAVLLMPTLGYVWAIPLVTIVLVASEAIVALVSPLNLVLEKELKLSRPIQLAIGGAFLAYGTAIALAFANAGVWSLLAVVVVTNAVTLFGTYRICKRELPMLFQWQWRFDPALAKRLLKRGLPTGLSVLGVSIAGHFDNFLIGTFIGYATLGLYDRAFRIGHWSNLILVTVMNRIAFVTFAKVQDDPLRLTHAVRLAMWISLVVGLPIALCTLFGAEELVLLLYGPRWVESAFYLRFLAVFSLGAPFINMALWLSAALGHRRSTVLLSIAQGLTIIVVATPLTFQYGIIGTLIGVGITEGLAMLASCVYVFRQVSLKVWRTFDVSLGAATITVAALWLLTQLPGWETWSILLRLPLIGGVGFGIFLLTTYLLRPAEMRTRVAYLRETWSQRNR